MRDQQNAFADMAQSQVLQAFLDPLLQLRTLLTPRCLDILAALPESLSDSAILSSSSAQVLSRRSRIHSRRRVWE